MKDVLDWQRRFREGPVVFQVYADGDPTGNFYESEDAANVEIEWRLKRGFKRSNLKVAKINVHSLRLAMERWEQNEP